MADVILALAVVGLVAAVAAGSTRLARLVAGDFGLRGAHRTIERGGVVIAAVCAVVIGAVAILSSI